MKIIKRDLGSEIEEFILVPLGDWHIGNKDCRLDTIQKKIEYVKNTPNAYCVLMGDLIECVTKESKGDQNSQTQIAQDQMYSVVDLLKPIKDKILGIVSGNHEARIYRDTKAFDIARDIAKHLELKEDLYDTTALGIFVSFGKNTRMKTRRHIITIYAKHNMSNGTTIPSSDKTLLDMTNCKVADVYIGGHTHQPSSFVEEIEEMNKNKKSVIKRKRAFLNGGADLGYCDYAENKSYKPKPIALVTLTCKVIHAHTQDYIQMSDQKIYY